MSIKRRTDKEDVVHIENGILLSHKKEQNNAICSNMDGPRDSHIEFSQRKTNIVWYHLYVESKVWHKSTYFTKQKQTHRRGELTCGCQGGGTGEGMDLECGISRCKLFYVGWINNKVLLCSPENYIRCPMINHSRKEYVYLYNWVALLYSRS